VVLAGELLFLLAGKIERPFAAVLALVGALVPAILVSQGLIPMCIKRGYILCEVVRSREGLVAGRADVGPLLGVCPYMSAAC
jgi:hypothetical protein